MREDDTPSRLEWLAAAQHDRCCYCDCDTWLPRHKRSEARFRAKWDMPGSRSMACQLAFDYRMATVEHLRGRDDVEADRPQNLSMACAYCNSTRHESSPANHRAAMLELKRQGRHPCFPA